MQERIVHIGLGKVASSTLQQIFFPEVVCSLPGVKRTYIGPDSRDQIHAIKLFLEDHLNEQEKKEIIDEYTKSPYLLSYEGLLSWNPEFWESSILKLKELVGSHVRIVLFVRKPEDYLRSVFQQAIAIGVNKSPELFFYEGAKPQLESSRYHNIAFNIGQFSYHRLVNLLYEHFEKVDVYSISALNNVVSLLQDFGVDDKELANSLSEKFETKRYNVSYNAFSMRILNGVNGFKRALRIPDYEFNLKYHHQKFGELSFFGKCRMFTYRLAKKLRPLDRILKFHSVRFRSAKFSVPEQIYQNSKAVAESNEYFSQL